ncbi:glycosyltransferase family 4 protein [Candidatus Woesebacteria bacterium]|nr:glycosyltransferase family 4 protein [Candidatus Woesebacteria bacterium]
MIIGIDGNETNLQNRVGVNVYGFELLWGLQEISPEWRRKHKLIVYLKNKPLSDMPKETDFFKYKIIPGGGIWILTKLMPRLLLNPDKLDLIFTPSHYVAPIAPIPRVCTITDLGYLKFPTQFKKYDYWQLKYWSAISMLVAKYIITISESSKNDIVRHYPSFSNKVFVTPLSYNNYQSGPNISTKNVRQIKNKYTIVSDYIIYVGTLKPSKNIEGLIEAYSMIKNEIPNIQLVIVGRKGWLYETVFQRARDLGLANKVIFTDFIPDEDKNILIKNSKLFVLPSFWEGFGLDVLSALASGVPVVASDVASLPEVVGNAGILVNPNDPKDIAHGMLSVLTMPKNEYDKLKARGIRQSGKFSWDETARKTLEILEKVE